MARKRFHGLKRVKLRATWSKYNLYNLSRLKIPNTTFQTFYQQKWSAKSMTRAYHGEHIREKYWQRLFKPRLSAVIPMDHRYLAEYDGSELAAGRGSGRDQPFGAIKPKSGLGKIPYMNMTYAPIERRLDMAIWRALFASSARQARQFVIHGNVKVNGKKMPYPGYLLNPGDMFQVEPERVLFATGAPKDVEQVRRGRKLRKASRRMEKETQPRALGLKDKKRLAETQKKEAEQRSKSAVTVRAESLDIEEIRKVRREDFKDLLKQAQAVLNNPKKPITVKRKQELRAFTKEARIAMSRVNRKTAQVLDDELNSLMVRLSLTQPQDGKAKNTETPEGPSEEKLKAMRAAIAAARENGIDESKPYATPWRPRPYMSAFAFIPRYLEVNQNICSAVYLRHPVARPSLAEVPSPFPPEVQQLAFNWYLRRR